MKLAEPDKSSFLLEIKAKVSLVCRGVAFPFPTSSLDGGKYLLHVHNVVWGKASGFWNRLAPLKEERLWLLTETFSLWAVLEQHPGWRQNLTAETVIPISEFKEQHETKPATKMYPPTIIPTHFNRCPRWDVSLHEAHPVCAYQLAIKGTDKNQHFRRRRAHLSLLLAATPQHSSHT